jgi:hypothetical protein
MNKLIYLWFAVKTVFCTCQPDHRINDFKKVRSHYKIKKISKLPTVANESSGLARGSNKGSYWTHNDSGGKTELYEFDLTGKLVSTKIVPGVKNTDWEDLAQDQAGNVFVGDFGNNSVPRTSFDIYKWSIDPSTAEKITFTYSRQKNSTGTNNTPIFDCESFFYYHSNLYLFSKNWGKDKSVNLYELPAEKGNHILAPVDSIHINTQVTSADISPDGKTFALLTYGKILLFGVDNKVINFKKPLGCFRLVKKQNEALIFLNNTDMLITNEQGDVYQITYH